MSSMLILLWNLESAGVHNGVIVEAFEHGVELDFRSGGLVAWHPQPSAPHFTQSLGHLWQKLRDKAKVN